MFSLKMGMFNVMLVAIFVSLTIFFGASRASPGRQLLVGYWGQNSAGRISDEKPLKEVCQTTKYNVLAVSFLTDFWDYERNENDLPALNFANHCETPISPENPSLFRCPKIEGGIKECQSRGIKVLLSIGGATGDGTLPSPPKAREFAQTLFDLFLGGSGKESLRPFGTEIMDGINLYIEGGRYNHYPDLIRELRRLMDEDNTRHYLIAVSPQCPYPDQFMGPEKEGTGLEEAGQYVDHVYVLFYNNFCSIGSKGFPTTLDKWLGFARSKQRPLIFVGVPAHAMASSNANTYQSPDKLGKIYEKIKTRAGFGGIMLWDVSWDQVNIIDGKRYSEYVYNLVNDSSVVEVKPATEAPEVPTQEQVAPPLQPPVQEAFTCTGKQDGIYPDPSSCAMYHVCSSGTKYEKSCPPGLKFNNAIKACDWSTDRTC